MKTYRSQPVSTLALAYRRGARFAVCHPALSWQTFVYLPYDVDASKAYSIAANGALSPVNAPDEYAQIMQAQGVAS